MTDFFEKQGHPLTGWVCTSVTDLLPDDVAGADTADFMQACVVCGTHFRYMHTLEHPETGATAEVGCECAGHMTGDPETSREQEKQVRSRSGRRSSFPALKGWRRSRSGGMHIKKNGRIYCVKPGRHGGYAASVKMGEHGEWLTVPGWHKSFELAAIAAYDAAESYAPPPRSTESILGDHIPI